MGNRTKTPQTYNDPLFNTTLPRVRTDANYHHRKKSKKKQSPIQKRFNRLNQQLERQKRLNKQFEKELDELTQSYRQHRQEANREQLDTLIALATKLITFAGRKSLSDWHRDEIDAWTEELVLHRISPVDANTAQELQQKYEESISHVLGKTMEEFQAHLNDTFSASHDEPITTILKIISRMICSDSTTFPPEMQTTGSRNMMQRCTDMRRP
jgi:DNA gyrase/topoisomerase IV subunit A